MDNLLCRSLTRPYFERYSRIRIPHLRHHFRPPPVGVIFTRNSATLSCDKLKKGAFLETHGTPRIPLRFLKIPDNLSPSVEALFRTIIPAKNSPFSASPPILHWARFLSKIWSILSRDYLTKIPFGDTRDAHYFLRFLKNRRQSGTVWRCHISNANRG